MQMGEDAAFYTAHDMFGLGAGRAEEFGNRYVENMNWIMGLILDDSKDDKEIAYAKELQDRRLRPIVGEKLFVPYDERYGNVDV